VGDCETARALLDKAGGFPVLVQHLEPIRLDPADGGPGGGVDRVGWAAGAVLATRNTVLGRWTRDGTCWSCSAPTLYGIGTPHWDCGSILQMLRLSIHPRFGVAWISKPVSMAELRASGDEPVIWITLLRGPSACAELPKYSTTMPIGPGPWLVWPRSHFGRGSMRARAVVAPRGGGGVAACRHGQMSRRARRGARWGCRPPVHVGTT